MKNMKKFAAVMAAAAMVTSTGMTAAAYEYSGNMGETGALTEDAKQYGHTTFSIIEAEQDPTNVSFTVPLFVTMAAVDGETALKVPTNYAIKNTSTVAAGAQAGTKAFDIAVVGMDFTKLQGATYSSAPSGTAKDVALSLGKMNMPTIQEDTTTFEVTKPVDIIGQTNTDFYDGTDLKLIKVGSTFNIDIVATLGAAPDFSVSGNKIAAPQFKVKYVVSGVTEDGDVLGAVYAGDDKYAAGIEALTAAE